MEDHPCFKPPKDENIRIWRFIDFTKYVSLLDSKTLFFSRADLLGDPYEGSISHVNKKHYPSIYTHITSKNMLKQILSVRKGAIQWTYVSCWYMNEHESNAMWTSTKTNKSVVIQSTYKYLYECLVPSEAYLGVVNYIDYEKSFMPEGNMLWPFIHKRQEFDYEKELRAVIAKTPPKINNTLNYEYPNAKKGIYVPVKALIHSVYTHPSAEHWFFELVKRVTQKYGYQFEVKESSMAKPPSF